MFYLLVGVISPYDGSYNLGLFSTLEKAREARSEFRREKIANGYGEPFESYEIYEFEPDVLLAEYPHMKPIEVFTPSKTKVRK